MHRKNLAMAMAASLLLAGLALGQTRVSGIVERLLPDSRAQAEDLEVMRRLLKDTLQKALHARAGSVPLVVAWRNGELYNIAPRTPAVAVLNPDVNSPLPGKAVDWGAPPGSVLQSQNDRGFNAWLWQAPQQNPATGECCIEGSNLTGYGVVYGIELPVHFIEKGKRGPAPTSKPMSQWDRMQKELRGEQVPADPKGNESEPEPIADMILKTLAENGHHLFKFFPKTPTGANERLTVVVTLRQGQKCEVCHSGHATAGQALLGNLDPAFGKALLDYDASGQADIYAANKSLTQLQGTASGSASKSPSGEKEASDQVLLGDLHMKQGRYKEAISAYKAALEKNHSSGRQLNMTESALAALAQNQGSGGQLNTDLARVEIASKLAQAQNAAGDHKGALETLAKVRELSQQAEKNARENKDRLAGKLEFSGLRVTEQSAAEQLPSKLTITVAKADLDAFHAGEIDLERFKKAATVDIQVFLPKGAASQAPGPDASGPKNATEPKQ